MWEYAVLSEKMIDTETMHVINHAGSSGTVRGILRVECEGLINKEAEGQGIISKVEGNVAIIYFREDKWDAEEPLFEWRHGVPSKMKEVQRAIAIWNNDEEVAKELGTDNATSTPHEGTGSIVDGPIKLLSGGSQKHKPLSI